MKSPVMKRLKRLMIYVVPVALMAAHASGAPSSGWGGIGAPDLAVVIGPGQGAPLVLVQRGGGGRGGGARASGGGGARSGFNSGNFQRDVSGNRNVSANRNVSGNVNVNRNVSVSGGGYGPNWGGAAAGVAVGVGVAAVAGSAAAASSAYYPPPPPYQYYPSGY
jgi:hypothetical protein